MRTTKPIGTVMAAAVLLLVWGVGCDRATPPQPGRAGAANTRAGVAELDPGAGIPTAAGQTIYVPAYSHIYTSSRADLFNLAVTLSIRNTDRAGAIVVSSVRYHDRDGRLVRDYVKKPLRVAPLAALEFFVAEDDTSGGSSASFLVEWSAGHAASDPVVEAVMIGTASTQGISFTCPGRVIADRTPAPAAPSAPRPRP